MTHIIHMVNKKGKKLIRGKPEQGDFLNFNDGIEKTLLFMACRKYGRITMYRK